LPRSRPAHLSGSSSRIGQDRVTFPRPAHRIAGEPVPTDVADQRRDDDDDAVNLTDGLDGHAAEKARGPAPVEDPQPQRDEHAGDQPEPHNDRGLRIRGGPI
jgi:hypothetical protein